MTTWPDRDFVGYGASVPKVRWPNDARVALSIVLNYEEGAESSVYDGNSANERLGELHYDGPTETRDLSVESVFEYGSRAGIWRVLRLLRERQVPVTVFACATALERNPAVARAIVADRHEICCHGLHWEQPSALSRQEEQERMRTAVAIIERLCGQRPLGWCYRYGPSVHSRSLLVEEGGFLYDSDAYNDDLPYYAEVDGKQHLVVPYSHTYNDGRFVTAPSYSGPRDFTDLCLRAIRWLWDEGETHPKMLSIGLHPRLIGQPGRIGALDEILDAVEDLGDVWIARRVDIARWWHDHHRSFEVEESP